MDKQQNAEFELRGELQRQGAAISWRDTPIGNYQGGILRDAERISGGQWWKRPVSGLAELTKFLSRDGKEEENEWGRERKREGTSASEVAEAQHDRARHRRKASTDEAQEWESYLPGPNDNMGQRANEPAKHVDTTLPEATPWYQALRTYISKFPASAIFRDMDEGTIRMLTKQICTGAYR